MAALLLTLLAQLPPPLARLLESARKQNHAIAISRAQLQEQDAAVEQAFAAFLPTLRGTGSYARNEYEAVVSFSGRGPPIIVQPYNGWNASVGLNVPVFTAPNHYRYAEAKDAREASSAAERASDAEVMLSTARAYFRVVGAQGVADAGRRALATARDSFEATNVKLKAGTQTRLAVDRAQVDVARAEQSLVSARQTLALATRNLETLTGERIAERFPDPGAPALPPHPEATYVEEALRSRPEVQQAAAALRQQETSLDEAWAQLAPSVNASATENFTNATGFIGHNEYWTIGVNLTWNVDPIGVRASAHRACAAVDEQRHRLLQAQDQVRDDVHSAWLDVDANAARVVQTESEMKSAQDALAITRQQYAAGTATSLDLSQAQRDAFTGEANFAQSRADLATALLALRKAAGEPFWEEPSP